MSVGASGLIVYLGGNFTGAARRLFWNAFRPGMGHLCLD